MPSYLIRKHREPDSYSIFIRIQRNVYTPAPLESIASHQIRYTSEKMYIALNSNLLSHKYLALYSQCPLSNGENKNKKIKITPLLILHQEHYRQVNHLLLCERFFSSRQSRSTILAKEVYILSKEAFYIDGCGDC